MGVEDSEAVTAERPTEPLGLVAVAARRSRWGELAGVGVQVRVPERPGKVYGAVIAGPESAVVAVGGRQVLRVELPPHADDLRGVEVVLQGPLAAQLARAVAGRVMREMTRAFGSGQGAAMVGAAARDATMRAFGCTCRRHSDAGAVYAEDVLCPLDGDTAVFWRAEPGGA